jgi:hypothetical protein
VNVIPERPRCVLRYVDVTMDLAVVPTQLTARQDTSRYRFAAKKYPRHSMMMRIGTDTKARLPPWL